MAPPVLIAMEGTGVFASLDFKGKIVKQVRKVLQSFAELAQVCLRSDQNCTKLAYKPNRLMHRGPLKPTANNTVSSVIIH